MVSLLTTPSAIVTSIFGCRPSRLLPRQCSVRTPETHIIGIGMSVSGLTVGKTSLTTNTVLGTEFSLGTIIDTATRKARPAKWTITPWAPAMRCLTFLMWRIQETAIYAR